ncbi:MAG: TolC family protein [Candidatus Korobacteraceae bacterium]
MHAKPQRSKRKTVIGYARVAALACALACTPGVGRAADPPATPIPFRNAIELALQHSGVMGIAAINQWRAHQAYLEVRANYIPQLTVGSALGYSYGFPLTLEGSAPSVVNFNSTQSLFNVALQKYLQAARMDWHATSLEVQDKRDTVILDTALSYDHLAQLTAKIAALTQAQSAAEKAQFVSEQRMKEGVDSKLDVTKSQLLVARIRLRIAEAEGQSDVLRQHLASLLGVPADSIAVDPASIPTMPIISQDEDLPSRAVTNSLAVKQAHEKTASAELRAEGEHKATILPTIDLASQYAYLAKYNNYDSYFLNYTANNLAAGLNIKFPLFNAGQKARAQEAKADALIAGKQEELSKQKVREDALQLQRSLRQLAAARDVARLEWEVSQGDLEAVKGRTQTGAANVRDEQNAELDSDDRHAAYLDAEFELSRAQLQLLRLTGELENWAIK